VDSKRRRTSVLTILAVLIALPLAAQAQQRRQPGSDVSAGAVFAIADQMVAATESDDAKSADSETPPGEEGTAAAAEVQNNGTNPAAMSFKFTPYTRYTELENGVTTSDVLTLFAMIPLPLTPFTALQIEWPVQKNFDASAIVLDYLEGTLDPELGIPCAPPECGSNRPLGDLPLEALAAGFDQNGVGDFNLWFLQGLKMFGKPGEGMTHVLLTGFQLKAPTASAPVLGEEKWLFSPMFAHIHNFSAKSFAAFLHLYTFDFADKSSISRLHKESDTNFYMGRYFFQYAWKSGYYLLPELQVAYDFNSDNDWSFLFMPEMGKAFTGGAMGVTTYFKPGWGISPDPAERALTVEMGIRIIP
jgi:hypothetical protein